MFNFVPAYIRDIFNLLKDGCLLYTCQRVILYLKYIDNNTRK
jgi:hypothetical protein